MKKPHYEDNQIFFIEDLQKKYDSSLSIKEIVDELLKEYPDHIIVVGEDEKLIGMAYIEEHFNFLIMHLRHDGSKTSEDYEALQEEFNSIRKRIREKMKFDSITHFEIRTYIKG
ncbi:hypothetical protein [Sulfurimonas sp.]|uniref:hypothetical protein n=1 Tax=Sulfurimonas sp. TaxID=2022749 RepID=UPI003D13BA5C